MSAAAAAFGAPIANFGGGGVSENPVTGMAQGSTWMLSFQ